MTNQVYFKKPIDIYEVKKTYTDDVEFLSDTSIFPLVKGIAFEGPLHKVIRGKKKLLNIQDKVDRLLELYKRKLFRLWDDHAEQILGNAPVQKADGETDAEKEQKKEIISEILGSLSLALGDSALPYYKQAYLLGKQRGVSISGKEFRQAISERGQERIAALKDKNQRFIDNFMGDLNQRYAEALDKEYASQEAQDAEIKRITASAESRLSLYVPAVLAALAFGFNEGLGEAAIPTTPTGAPTEDTEAPEEVTGIIWVTNHDDAVCPGCAENDGKFFTFDEFEQEYQSNECISNCRCAETSEPTTAPMAHFARSARVENLIKGGEGSGSWDGPGMPRFAWTPEHEEKFIVAFKRAYPNINLASENLSDEEKSKVADARDQYEEKTEMREIGKKVLAKRSYFARSSTSTLIQNPKLPASDIKTPIRVELTKENSAIPVDTAKLAFSSRGGDLRDQRSIGTIGDNESSIAGVSVRNAYRTYPEHLQQRLSKSVRKVTIIDDYMGNVAGQYIGFTKKMLADNLRTDDPSVAPRLATIEINGPVFDDLKQTETEKNMIMVHELAHALDYSYLQDKGIKFSMTRDWKDAMLTGRPITTYAKKNEREYFAEAVTSYLFIPDHLQKANKKAFSIIDGLFKNKLEGYKFEKRDITPKGETDLEENVDDFRGSIIEYILEALAEDDTVEKGGPGSGCNPSVGDCGRPSTGGSDISNKATRLFGVTDNFKNSPFINLDGQGLDAYKDEYNDHDFIARQIIPEAKSNQDALVRVLQAGLIRNKTSGNNVNIEIMTRPTEKQMIAIQDAMLNREDIFVDISTPEKEGGRASERFSGFKDFNAFINRHFPQKFEKGGEGSGSWDGPGNPRFAWSPQHVSDMAHRISEEAKIAEPKITSLAENLAHNAGGVLRGKDFRLKTEESLNRKINTEWRLNPHLSPEEMKGTIKDAVRYTVELKDENYTDGVQKSFEDIKAQGHTLVKSKNYWQKGDPYQGLNAVFRSPEGQLWEMQFHTKDSYELTTGKLHPIYEEFRISPDPMVRKNLWDKMTALADGIKVPVGVLSIGALTAQVLKFMKDATRYFALQPDLSQEEFSGLFRLVNNDSEGLFIQYLDKEGNWIEEPELARFLVLGTEGAQEITADRADEMINNWTDGDVKKGGPGSGCQGPNCGRPHEGGTVEYHGTSPENAKKILQEGFKTGPGQAGVSTTQGYEEALDYANGNSEGVLEVSIHPAAEMAGVEGKDFLSGTASWHPKDIRPLKIATRPTQKFEKGGPGSGCNPAVGDCGRPAGSGMATEERPNLLRHSTERQQFIRDLKSERDEHFKNDKSSWDDRATHNEEMNIFFGIDWVGQDQASQILRINQMFAEANGSKISDEDLMDVFSKMRPGIPPQYALPMAQVAFTGVDKDGKMVDRSQGFFAGLMKEKEFSNKKFGEVFGDKVTVYKGIPQKYANLLAPSKGVMKVKDMPLSSYTINRKVAEDFAGKGGAVLQREITADDVLAGVHSHHIFNEPFGKRKLGEGEIIVINKSPYTEFTADNIRFMYPKKEK